jgi:hypothetical protein
MAEANKEIELEIAHVLFIDIVGYSKLSINDQHAAVEELNQVVRASEQFQRAEGAERLLKIATGDGMASVFYTSPEAPAQCAVEVCERPFQLLQLRRRAMHFYPGEIGHGEHLCEQRANVVQMCEDAFGVGLTFAAENFVAVNGKLIRKHLFLSCRRS